MNNLTIPAGFGQLGTLALNKPLSLLNPHTPLTVNDSDNLLEAIALLQECHIGCAVVVDKNGKLTGMLSERDILMKWVLSDSEAEEVPVIEIMTPNPSYIPTDEHISTALYMMSKGGFRHLPIVNKEMVPEGIISVKDIMDFISLEFMRNLVR